MRGRRFTLADELDRDPLTKSSSVEGTIRTGLSPQRTMTRRLRLLSYNMQIGIRTQRPLDYLRQSWRHLMPAAHATRHLEPIARMLRGHDIVALQEADAGSLRTRAVNLVHFLAQRADYPHWYLQVNRDLAPLARHAMGVLSRFPVDHGEHHPLPGHLPGRSAALFRFGNRGRHLTVVATHLALSRSIRARQLAHIHDLVRDDEHLVLMGDLNCDPMELQQHPLLRERELQVPEKLSHSYPSWRPERLIDHILISPGIPIREAGIVDFAWSDHLPVAVEIELPADIAWDLSSVT